MHQENKQLKIGFDYNNDVKEYIEKSHKVSLTNKK
jgi:hypothetical protein